jgi:hypothetical protein
MWVATEGLVADFNVPLVEGRLLAKSGCGLRSSAARRTAIACRRNEAGNRLSAGFAAPLHFVVFFAARCSPLFRIAERARYDGMPIAPRLTATAS